MRRLGPISLDGPLFSPVFFPPQPKIQAPLHCRKRWRHIAFFYSNSATRPMLGPVVCCCPISSQAYLSRSPVGYLGSFGGSSLPLSLPSYSPSSSPPLITTWPSFIASCRLGQIQPALQAGRYQLQDQTSVSLSGYRDIAKWRTIIFVAVCLPWTTIFAFALCDL
ncbi:hypothetical protein BKA64DRAFT_369399 [Cadophora sp. MPI-SDFR-AT-0126]|nr:hypothetical protein BKA64DRAFT_369399 [Leotiomycetes sp. MPI-SDFR-AT-0126]